MSRTTAIFAVIFFVTSFSLAMVARQKADSVSGAGVPAVIVEEVVPAGDAPLSAGSASEGAIESDSPVIDSTAVEIDEKN